MDRGCKYFLEHASQCRRRIRSLEQIKYLVSNGADKIIVNTKLWEDSDLIKQAITEIGSQSVVASVDCCKKQGEYYIYNSWEKRTTTLHADEGIRKAIRTGAGEILLTSVDNEGMMNGFDKQLLEYVPKELGIH